MKTQQKIREENRELVQAKVTRLNDLAWKMLNHRANSDEYIEYDKLKEELKAGGVL